ncbi:MAG: M42 family peptidase [Clostridiales bacterium]|nr:M42 family peptidase [Clostridiales bacterium]
MNIEELKKLCLTNGTSGDEGKVRNAIIGLLPDYCSYEIDKIGNLIVDNNKPVGKNTVALFAHMDEVGFIVTFVTDEGYAHINSVGGIKDSALFGKKITVNGHIGLAGGKAIHQCDKDESKKIPEITDLLIDFGYPNKEEAVKEICPGDFGYFVSEFTYFGDNMIKSKAIDDRFGCLILLEILRHASFGLKAVFTVQEEIGTRGATVAGRAVNPDYAIVVESTTASDIPDTPDHKAVCKVGKGAVVSFMDKGTVYDNTLYKEAMALADTKGIPAQTKSMVAGGNDAAAIHKSANGIKTLTVSLPCRYIHSASSVASIKDMESVEKLVFALAEKYSNG